MSVVDDLVAAATVGLGVRSVDFTRWPEELRPPEGVAAEDAGTALDVAALAAVARRSGGGLAADQWAAPVPPDLSAVKPWSPAARGILRQLGEQRPEIVAAAVRIVASHGAAWPIREVPELAVKALQPGSPLRAVLAQAVGAQGQWLLAQNPAWRVLLRGVEAAGTGAEPTDDEWLHGSLGRRKTWLAARRTGDPAAARDELARVWKQEKAADKIELLGALSTGLSVGDVDFLERVRGERAAKVREAALKLLSRIPEGAFAERRKAMLVEHVEVRKPLLGKGKLHLAAFDADPAEGIAEGAERSVTTFIEYTPLSLWSQVFHRDPGDLVGLEQTGVAVDLGLAFLAAARTQRDPGVMAQMVKVVDQPWTRIWTSDLDLFPDKVRMEIVRDLVRQAGQPGLHCAIEWLGSPLPPEILDDCIAIIGSLPDLLGLPEVGPAFLLADAAQVAKLRVLVESVSTGNQPAARRALTYLTLLTRLDQELS